MTRAALWLWLFASSALFSASLAEPGNKSGIPAQVSMGPGPLNIKSFTVSSREGTPAGQAEMDSPTPDDFPPSVTLQYEDEREYPASKKGPRYMIAAANLVRVYNIRGVATAPYKTIQPDLDRLRQLLKERPAKASTKPPGSAPASTLPDYPPQNAAHLLEAKLAYLDAAWGSGLFYLTQFVQDESVPNNEQLVYLFQGLSKDGNYFVSAEFRITHPDLPGGIDDLPAEVGEHVKLADKLVADLPKKPDDSFSPSLKKLRDWMGTLKIGEE